MPPISSTESPTPDLRTVRGTALRSARSAVRLSARELADRVNLRTDGSDITQHAIYAYESGKVLLSREMGVRVAEALNLHPGELLAGEPDFKAPAVDPATGRTAPADKEAARWLALAGAVLPVSTVLHRLLDGRKVFDSDIDGFIKVFHLLQTDLAAVTSAPQADTLRGPTGLDQPTDPAATVLTACETLADTVENALENLVESGPSPVRAAKACSTAANAIREAADELAGKLKLANKAYGVEG